MSSLSSVVSDLVRASMGSSVAPTVTDEELDKHVRELLIRDAKKRAERYGQQGIRAYLASGLSDSNAPKANKRFLSSVIRSTDEHNKTILRAQALSAEEIKRERREQEMKERRARAEEAVRAEKLRRSSSSASHRRAGDSEAWDRWDGTTSDRKRKRRNWETWTGEEDEEERHRSRRRTSHRSRSRSLNNNKESRSNRRSSRRSRSRDDRASSSKIQKRRSRSPRNSYHKSSGETHSSRRNKEKVSYRRDSRSVSPSSSREYDREDYSHRPSKHKKDTKDESKPKRRYALSSSDEEDAPRRRSRSLTVQSDLGSAYAYSSSSRYHSPEPPVPSSSSTTLNRESELRKKLQSKYPAQDTSHLREEERVKEDSATTRSSQRNTRSRHSRSPDPKPKRRKASRSSRSSQMSISRSPTPGPEQPGPALPSKMDKYFDESYDPRLDVAPLSAAPKVPATGLIDSAEFEGWDTMLDLIRIRREDKAEKKRLERMGLSKDEVRKTMFGDLNAVGTASGGSVSDRWAGEGVSAMDIQYNKRGAVREWDMGKESF
ncbi:hypothetical protein C8J55DRAFT_154756 [Lentinula edodes]|uniref:Uncharacterized protein n=1 Tax=Lentinula lateritia TaxID=40482 RepID=A0A9W9A376_9AGAR|nr:hypothetical protein C8J55DRAFT_154756 [Lentinula edodes]